MSASIPAASNSSSLSHSGQSATNGGQDPEKSAQKRDNLTDRPQAGPSSTGQPEPQSGQSKPLFGHIFTPTGPQQQAAFLDNISIESTVQSDHVKTALAAFLTDATVEKLIEEMNETLRSPRWRKVAAECLTLMTETCPYCRKGTLAAIYGMWLEPSRDGRHAVVYGLKLKCGHCSAEGHAGFHGKYKPEYYRVKIRKGILNHGKAVAEKLMED